jgi:hypothetical protein
MWLRSNRPASAIAHKRLRRHGWIVASPTDGMRYATSVPQSAHTGEVDVASEMLVTEAQQDSRDNPPSLRRSATRCWITPTPVTQVWWPLRTKTGHVIDSDRVIATRGDPAATRRRVVRRPAC